MCLAGALKFWQGRSQADFRAAEKAVWGDESVDAALQSADEWVQGLPFVQSLAGQWSFHLASSPERVPEHFFSPDFDDAQWGTIPGMVRGNTNLERVTAKRGVFTNSYGDCLQSRHLCLRIMQVCPVFCR